MRLYPKQFKWGALAAGVIVLLFFFHYIGILRPVENAVTVVLEPVQRLVYGWGASINTVYQDTRTKNELLAENEELRQRVNEQLIDESRSKIIEEENAFLRSQLNYQEGRVHTPVVAAVISKSKDSTSNTFVVDKGRKDGVSEGFPVVVQENIMVGKVIKSNDHSSVVLWLNDHNAQAAASILNHDKTMGVVKGEYGLGVKMELIPQIEEVVEGDLVVTSGVEEYIPRGLVLGTVDAVVGSEEDLFKEAIIKLPVDLNKVHLVSVLIPDINDNTGT